MSKTVKRLSLSAGPIKESRPMSKRLASLVMVLGIASLLLLAVPCLAAAASPWWQVLSGSRPTNLWKPTDNIQEIITTMANVEGFGEGTVQRMEAGGQVVGCLGSQTFVGEFGCEAIYGTPAITDAEQLEAKLESLSAFSNVKVTGGPVGVSPLIVTVPGSNAPTIGFNHENLSFGTAETKILSVGGSGRLVLTVTNLGDAPVDATATPVNIVDKLPEGAVAAWATATAGLRGQAGPVSCTVEAPAEVSCGFKGELPPYEAIEVEIAANLTGDPPAAGAPGEVSVSGGNAPAASIAQPIKVSPESVRFGAEYFSSQAEEEGGAPTRQAGIHPFQLTTTLQLNAGQVTTDVNGNTVVEQPALPRNMRFPLPVGLVGNATTAPRCTMTDFLDHPPTNLFGNNCPDDSAIGLTSVTIIAPGTLGLVRESMPVFNLPPAHGEPARFGFMPAGDPVVIDTAVDPQDRYRVVASIRNVTELAEFLGSTLSFWGVPGDPRHDNARGWSCVHGLSGSGTCERPKDLGEKAFLRMPVSCASPLEFGVSMEPWNVPIGSVLGSATVTGDPLLGCNRVPFDPSITTAPTSKLAESPSGLSFELEMPNSGLLNPGGIAEAQPKKVVVTLPEGVTVNPSAGEGLVACTEAEYARETAGSKPGEGCPEASKIGNVQISTPLLEEEPQGALYLAKPHENPFGSLVAIYLVAKIPDRGVIIKLAGRIDPDPVTGQLVTTFDDNPEVPFSKFALHFREGARAPLVTPPGCGTFQTVARFVPWSAQNPNDPAPGEVVERTSSFTIEHGVDGGACPASGTPPFSPQVVAGTQNNAGGSYSPFYMRILRKDGEQEITKFSTVMPPGLSGNLTGIPFCQEAAIQAARNKTGAQELAEPSCPAASEIGHSLVGAGVGSVLAYTPGKIYLAGPYHGSALSIVSVTSATVGPFDLGTVVIRFALRINPTTAQVEVDSTGSDPIPHIIEGIVVHVRDIRVYIDREKFMLNPTSCAPMSFSATVSGSGASFASTTDDVPVTLNEPFQAADCQALRFKPSFIASTSGKTSRTNGASLTVKLTYPKAPLGTQSNIRSVRVELPKQLPSRLSTLQKACPDAVFDQDPASCPAESRVGYAKANTPILPVPIEGPAYFVSHGGSKWPELIVVLQGYGVTIDLHGETFIDKGITSSTFRTVPDQPVSSFQLTLPQGPDSALASPASLCNITRTVLAKHKTPTGKTRKIRKTVAGSLVMPTTFTAQNGLVIHQDTKIAVTGCARHKTRRAHRRKGHH
jgi:hypothetical protein